MYSYGSQLNLYLTLTPPPLGEWACHCHRTEGRPGGGQRGDGGQRPPLRPLPKDGPSGEWPAHSQYHVPITQSTQVSLSNTSLTSSSLRFLRGPVNLNLTARVPLSEKGV